MLHSRRLNRLNSSEERLMHLDVVDYRRFYDAPLGHAARRMIRRRLRALWPDVRGSRILGLGYATPFLGPFRDDAERVLALMPAGQGVAPWPRGANGLVALADETDLPLPDASMDRVLLVHSVENTEVMRQLLRQVWRVMAPSGRLIVVAPNRASLWAQSDRTPFGHGRPFTRDQLDRTLKDAMFTPQMWDRALCMPPWRWRYMVRYSESIENMGQSLWPRFAGVLMVDAIKQAYAVIPAGAQRSRARILVPEAHSALLGHRSECLGPSERRPPSARKGSPLPPQALPHAHIFLSESICVGFEVFESMPDRDWSRRA
jgi:SAM-dependent methyltransferase